MEDPIGRWVMEILLLVFCALLACAQAALTNANEGKLRAAAEEDGRLKRLLAHVERPDSALTALRGLRTLFLLLFAALGAGQFGSVWSGALFCVGAAPVIMALCKLAPEKLGRRRADRTVLVLRPLILAVTWVMTPFTALERLAARGMIRLCGVDPHARDEVTEEDIRALMDIGEESGVIEHDERDMIKNVFEFGDLTAADCMTHRTDVTALWVGDDDETVLRTIRESGLSRFPVYDEDIDDVVGVLATRDYLLNAGEKPLRSLLRDAYFVPETVPTDVLLRNMQLAKTHMAIVVDEYGGMSGVITMEDLLEEIVGNIYDEFDPTAENEIQPLGGDTWRISGAADLETVADALGVTLPQDEDYDTLGGLIFSRYSTIPEDGSTPTLTLPCTQDGEEPDADDAQAPIDRLEVQVESIVDRRVEWAKVHVLRAPGKTDDSEA